MHRACVGRVVKMGRAVGSFTRIRVPGSVSRNARGGVVAATGNASSIRRRPEVHPHTSSMAFRFRTRRGGGSWRARGCLGSSDVSDRPFWRRSFVWFRRFRSTCVSLPVVCSCVCFCLCVLKMPHVTCSRCAKTERIFQRDYAARECSSGGWLDGWCLNFGIYCFSYSYSILIHCYNLNVYWVGIFTKFSLKSLSEINTTTNKIFQFKNCYLICYPLLNDFFLNIAWYYM